MLVWYTVLNPHLTCWLIIMMDSPLPRILLNTDSANAALIQAALTHQACLYVSSGETADLVITSQLPHGHFSQQYAQASVLFIADPPDPVVIDTALEAGADDCLSWPTSANLLSRRIRMLLEVGTQMRHGQFRLQSTLRETEQRYRNLFDAANDAILIIDGQSHRVADANRIASRWLGYAHDELLTMSLDDIVVPQDRQREDQVLHELSSSGRLIYEQIYRRKDGSQITVEVSSRIIDFEGRYALLNFVRDISQRRRMEEAERQQRILAEALSRSSAAVNSTLELELVLSRILEYVQTVVPCEAANIMQIEDGRARIIGSHGYDANLHAAQISGPEIVVEQVPSLNWIYQNRQALCIPDTANYVEWITSGDKGRIRSYIGAPIIVEDAVIGFINLDSSAAGHFTRQNAEALHAFAHHVGIAIRNANLYRAAQLHAGSLEQRVAHRTEQLSLTNAYLEEQVEERRMVENALAKERNRLRTLIDNLIDEVYVKDLDGHVVLANAPLLARLGKAPDERAEELLEISQSPLLYPEGTDEALRTERRILETGQPLVNYEVQDIQTGHNRRILVTKVPLREQDGQLVGLIGVHRDITELRGTQERLLHVIMGANCLLWYATVDQLEDDSLHWNCAVSSEAASMRFLPLDIKEGETYFQAWERSIVDEDKAMVEQTAHTAVRNNQSGFSQEFRSRRADGEIRWLYEEVQVKRLAPGKWSVVGVATDITERKLAVEALKRTNDSLEQRVAERTAVLQEQIAERQRAELALRESEARFRALVEHAPEAIVVFDAKTERFIDANKNVLVMFGLSREDFLKHGLLDFSPVSQPDGKRSAMAMRHYIQEAISGSTPVFEWLYHSLDGTTIPCEMRLLLLPTSGSLHIRGSITDITERKQAQAALEASEAKYRSLTNQLPIGVYRVTEDGTVVFCNTALARILGVGDVEQLIGS